MSKARELLLELDEDYKKELEVIVSLLVKQAGTKKKLTSTEVSDLIVKRHPKWYKDELIDVVSKLDDLGVMVESVNVGSQKLGSGKLCFFNAEVEKVPTPIAKAFPKLMNGITPTMTLDQAKDMLDKNMQKNNFSTGSELCIDINGKRYYYTDGWTL